jgi:hypothetical protein
VRDDEGRPVKARRSAEGPVRIAPPTERTDARGEFLMPGIRPGEYTVVAREGGLAPGIAAVVVEPETEARVEVLLSEGGFVTGRIVDPDGRPLAGRLRLEVVDEHGLPSSESDRIAADAKADGTFALGPPGALGIGARHRVTRTRRVEVSVIRRAAVISATSSSRPASRDRGRVRRRGHWAGGLAVGGACGARGAQRRVRPPAGRRGVRRRGAWAGTYRSPPSHRARRGLATALAGGSVDLGDEAGRDRGRVVDELAEAGRRRESLRRMGGRG